MGRDLTLLPAHSNTSDGEKLCLTALRMERDDTLMDAIWDSSMKKGGDIRRALRVATVTAQKLVVNDSYQSRIRFIYNSDLPAVFKLHTDIDRLNKGILNYLKFLDPDLKIYLFWD